MKIITQEELRTQVGRQEKYIWDFINVDELHKKLKSKYGEFSDSNILFQKLGDLVSYFDVLNGNKTVLDLGCGARSGYDQSLSKETFPDKIDFQPILPRALHELGIKVIGIDYGNLDGEEFEHYSLNLLDENSLGFLPDHSIDIAHSALLFSSPQLIKLTRCAWESDTREKLKEVLFPQLERIVKPNGFYYVEESHSID